MSPNQLKLTRRQKAAVKTLNKSVSVSGGPGSGKTEVLIRRFCHIVERGKAGVDEILAITLTERAAAEMKERVASRFAALGREDDRRAVERASIGTIHSFCHRVLRESPFEAGVDPRFSVLGAAQQRLFADQILESALDSRRAEESLTSFLHDHGPDQAKDAVFSIHSRLRRLGVTPSKELIARPNDPRPLYETFERCLAHFLESLRTRKGLRGRSVESIRLEAAEALPAAERLLSALDWSDFQRLKEFDALLSSARISGEAARRLPAARHALSDFLGACLDEKSSGYAELLLDLAADFGARFSLAKTRRGCLDFDDLLCKAREVLLDADGRPTKIAERYRRQLRYVMLDEFQDTSRLVKEIAAAVSRPDNLFTVGDAAQSIFSFLDADVGAFREHHSGRGRRALSLRENFRSRGGIADFANWFFRGLPGGDIGFEESKPAHKSADKQAPAVEVILVPSSISWNFGQKTPGPGRSNEAAAVARRILEMTLGGPQTGPFMLTRGPRAGEPLELRDIALLLRSTTHLPVYERALREHGVAARALGGRGFYRRQEVRDVVSLLRMIDDPLDDIAAAAVLRSPFAGVSECALFWLCRDWSAEAPDLEVPPLNENPGKLREGLSRLEAIPYLSDPDRSALLAFRGLLDEMAEVQGGAAEMIGLALERSPFGACLLAMPDGLRKYANVLRLREIAREFEAGGSFGVQYFLAYVQRCEDLAERDAEIPPDEAEDAVRIMTIHRAKGLQSPVVFVADMSRVLLPRSDLCAFDPESGLAVQVRNPQTGELESPLCHKETALRAHDRDIAEEKRLLYVAMTRAEERLVLVGSSDLAPVQQSARQQAASWSGWLEGALELGPQSRDGECRRGRRRVDFKRSVPRPSERPGPERTTKPTLASRFARELAHGLPIEESTVSPSARSAAEGVIRRCLDFAEPAPAVSRLSVSRVLDYLECPARYRLVHVLGMPERGSMREGSAARIGQLVHDLLRDLDFAGDLSSRIEDAGAKIADQSLREQVLWPLARFAESRRLRDLLGADRILREVPFELVVGGTVLAGRIDLMYHLPGGWTILDYKTGQAEDRERYELQVGMYAHAAFRLLGEMPAECALLLLSIGDEWTADTSDGSLARLAAEKVGEVAVRARARDFAPRPGRACEWCSFGPTCEGGP